MWTQRREAFGILYLHGTVQSVVWSASGCSGHLCSCGSAPVSEGRANIQAFLQEWGERLREHFRARDLFERRETTSFGKSRLDLLREELVEFGGPEYEAVYQLWRKQGDSVLGAIETLWTMVQVTLRHTG